MDQAEFERRMEVVINLGVPCEDDETRMKTGSYRLDQRLDLNDTLVLQRRLSLINKIQLDKMTSGLEDLTRLVDLAYNAMPPREGELHAALGQLQIDYADLCLRCSTAMHDVKIAAESVGGTINTALSMLFRGRWETALRLLSLAGKSAKELARTMKELADNFEDLAGKADTALSEAEIRRGDEEKAREALEKARQQWEVKRKYANSLRKELTKLVGELQVKYDAAEKDLKKTEDRAFTLAVIGAVMKPLGEGIGGAATAVALIYSGPPSNRGGTNTGGGGDAPSPQPEREPDKVEVPKEKQEELDTAREALEVARDAADLAESDEEELKAELEVVEDRLEKIESSETVNTSVKASYEERRRDLEALIDKIGQAKTKLEDDKAAAQRRFDMAKSAVEALGVTVKGMGEEFSKMGHDYLELAESKRDQVEKLFDLIMQKKDLEREQIARKKEATAELANISTNIDSAAVTIRSLVLVINSLRQVASILHEAAEFWRLMQKGCERLAKSKTIKELKILSKGLDDLPADVVADMFDIDSVKEGLLIYKADWAALENVASEYIDLTDDIYQEADARRRTTLSREDAQAHVADLAKRMLGDIEDEENQVEGESQALQDAHDAAQNEAA